ncbi:MAG: hypothetical protein GXY34_09830 [Syntrophomonadaceae bacterium]|nr:hypothetical protein [Syntrophomonadaceae bacterium]
MGPGRDHCPVECSLIAGALTGVSAADASVRKQAELSQGLFANVQQLGAMAEDLAATAARLTQLT